MGERRQEWDGSGGRRGRLFAARTACVAGAAAVAAAAGMLLGGADAGRLAITATPEPGTSRPASDADPAGPPVGTWSTGPSAPLIDRAGHSVTWTGQEIVVWAGRSRSRHLDDGAAYDPRRATWRPLAEAPIRSRTDHAAVWNGEELLIWGGRRTDDFGPLALADGAAYHPATDTWRTLAEAPIQGRWSPVAVWTGDELLVWGGRAQQLRTVHLGDGAAYNVERDAWRLLPAPPVRVRWSPAAVWTGDELLAWGAVSASRSTTSGAAYRMATGTWRHLGATPLAVAVPAVAGWTGTQALLVTPDLTLVYERTANRWTRAAPVPVAVRSTTRAVWTGDDLVVIDGRTGRAASVARSGQVQPLPELHADPGPFDHGSRFNAAWTGESLVLVGGRESGDRLGTRVWRRPG